jgi:hypothetical protein
MDMLFKYVKEKSKVLMVKNIVQVLIVNFFLKIFV